MPASLIGPPEERAVKHARVAEYLESHDLDAAILSRRCNFSWYTCGAHNYVATACDAGNSWLLIDRNRATVLTNNIEATRLRAEDLSDTDIEIVEFPYHDPAKRSAAFDKATGSMRVAADAGVPGRVLPGLGEDFGHLRWTLTSWEMDRYRSLCEDVVACVEAAARRAEPRQSENDLAGMLSEAILARGCTPWVLLVAGDDRVRQHRHPLPTDRKIEQYAMLAVCAERSGLIAACTRLVSFGAVSEDLAARHEAVATVDAALILATCVGNALGDIFAEARDAYAAVGFAEQWRRHHQGGSCGYLPREVKAAPEEKTVVLADQAFAWNPSITGTKSEDTIVCTEEGPQLLAGPTDWPSVTGQWKGRSIPRPAILEKG